MGRLHVLADPSVVLPGRTWETALDELTAALRTVPRLQTKVYLHIRAKAGPRSRWADARRRTRILDDEGIPVIFHGLQSDALALGFKGVHWPEALIPSQPPKKPSAGPVGASVHNRTALERAEHAGVDYVFFSPIFPPTSKPGSGVGIAALAQITAIARVPVVALGGMTPERISSCLDAGAAGVAVLGGIFGRGQPKDILPQYLEPLT